jgi:hypothetical protein
MRDGGRSKRADIYASIRRALDSVVEDSETGKAAVMREMLGVRIVQLAMQGAVEPLRMCARADDELDEGKKVRFVLDLGGVPLIGDGQRTEE